MQRIPIKLARVMGDITARYKWFPVFYLVILFIVFPACIFALACIGPLAVTIGVSPVYVAVLIICIVKWMQNHYLEKLPHFLRKLDFKPDCFPLLKSIDNVLVKITSFFEKIKSLLCFQNKKNIETLPQISSLPLSSTDCENQLPNTTL